MGPRGAGRLCKRKRYLLQVEESLHAGILGHVAQPPIVCQRTQWGPDYLKCSGEVNSPCAKVFACGKNACTAQSAAPSSSQSPLCSVSACGKNFAALPCSSSPQTTHCVGLVWGSPRWGPEELGDRKSKAAQLGGFAKGNDTYFRLKKAFMPGYSATSPSLPLCAIAHNGDPVI